MYDKYDIRFATRFTEQHPITKAITASPQGAKYLLDQLGSKVRSKHQPMFAPVHVDTIKLVSATTEPDRSDALRAVKFLEGFTYDPVIHKEAADVYYKELDRLMVNASELDTFGFDYKENGDLYHLAGMPFNPRLTNNPLNMAKPKEAFITERTRTIFKWIGQYLDTFQPYEGKPYINHTSADKEPYFATNVAYKLENFEYMAHTPGAILSVLQEASNALSTGYYNVQTFLDLGIFPTCYEGQRLQADQIKRSGTEIIDYKKREGFDWFGKIVEADRKIEGVDGLIAMRYRKFVPYGVRLNSILQVWSADTYERLHDAFHSIMDMDPRAAQEYADYCDVFTIADISKCDVNTSYEIHKLVADVLMPPDSVTDEFRAFFLFMLQLPQYERPDYEGMQGLRFSHEPGVFLPSPLGTTSGIASVSVITKVIGIAGLTEIMIEAGELPMDYDSCVAFWNNRHVPARGKSIGDNISVGLVGQRDVEAIFSKAAENVKWHDFKVDPRGAIAGLAIQKGVVRVNLINYSRKLVLPEFAFGGKHSPFKLFGMMARQEFYSTHPCFSATHEALNAMTKFLTSKGTHTFPEFTGVGLSLDELTKGQRQALNNEFGVLDWNAQRLLMEPTAVYFVDGLLEKIPEDLLRRMFAHVPDDVTHSYRIQIYKPQFLKNLKKRLK